MPRKGASCSRSLNRQIHSLAKSGMTRFFRQMFEDFPDLLMKDVTVEATGPDRTMRIDGQWVHNFGSDSFLGLDQHPAVIEAVDARRRASGARTTAPRGRFPASGPMLRPRRRSPTGWAPKRALIYPSVTLANVGALPGSSPGTT